MNNAYNLNPDPERLPHSRHEPLRAFVRAHGVDPAHVPMFSPIVVDLDERRILLAEAVTVDGTALGVAPDKGPLVLRYRQLPLLFDPPAVLLDGLDPVPGRQHDEPAPGDVDTTLDNIDAAVQGLCANDVTRGRHRLPPDAVSAYWCGPACEQAWRAKHTADGVHEIQARRDAAQVRGDAAAAPLTPPGYEQLDTGWNGRIIDMDDVPEALRETVQILQFRHRCAKCQVFYLPPANVPGDLPCPHCGHHYDGPALHIQLGAPVDGDPNPEYLLYLQTQDTGQAVARRISQTELDIEAAREHGDVRRYIDLIWERMVAELRADRPEWQQAPDPAGPAFTVMPGVGLDGRGQTAVVHPDSPAPYAVLLRSLGFEVVEHPNAMIGAAMIVNPSLLDRSAPARATSSA